MTARKRRGSAIVETSLILVVVIVMLIGIFDFAQFLFVHQSLVERVRKATRYGVVNPYDAEKIRNVVLYEQPTPPKGINVQAGFALTASMVEVSRADAGTPEDRLVVTVQNYPFRFFSPLIGGLVKGMPITASMSYEEP